MTFIIYSLGRRHKWFPTGIFQDNFSFENRDQEGLDFQLHFDIYILAQPCNPNQLLGGWKKFSYILWPFWGCTWAPALAITCL